MKSQQSTLGRLVHDDSGMVVALEVVLIVLVIGLGVIAGLASLRDGFNQELGDTGLAINNLDQGYSISGVMNASGDSANGSSFNDETDDNDGPDTAGQAPPGMQMSGHVSTGE